MRRRYALLLGVCVVVAVAAPAAAAAESTTTDAPTHALVTGTVTHPDGSAAGDAVVLVGSYALFAKSSPSDLRDIASSDPQDVAVVAVETDGSFSTHLPPEEAEAVVAVGADGVSEVRRVDPGEPVALVLRDGKPLSVDASNATAAPGETVTLEVAVRNNDDVPVLGLAVQHAPFPPGWRLVRTSTTGTYYTSNRTFAWESLAPDEWARAELVVEVPADAEDGIYEVGLDAGSDGHAVSATRVTVAVREPRTTTLLTGTPGDTDGETAEGAGDGGEDRSGVPVPGFGVTAAVAALAAAVVVATRRID